VNPSSRLGEGRYWCHFMVPDLRTAVRGREGRERGRGVLYVYRVHTMSEGTR